MSNHYTYRAEWSPEDGEYVGLVAEFPSLSWLAATAGEAVAGASDLVDGILADMAETGETAPEPLTQRKYSGNLSFRTSPAQHRALAIEAAEQGVSVNQLLVYKTALRALTEPARREAAADGDEQKEIRVIHELKRTFAPKFTDLPDSVQTEWHELMQSRADITGMGQIASQLMSADTLYAVREAVMQNTGLNDAISKAITELHHDAAAALGKIGTPTLDALVGPERTARK